MDFGVDMRRRKVRVWDYWPSSYTIFGFEVGLLVEAQEFRIL